VQDPLPGLRSAPWPPPELIEQACTNADRNEWIFAKTMADNPHWYTVLSTRVALTATATWPCGS